MKIELTLREKVLMGILVVLLVFCAYYFLFLLPVNEQINNYTNSNYEVEDQIILADAKVSLMKQMEKELEAIYAGEKGEVKELPAYDNGNNVMNSLSTILKDADNYSISFSNVTAEESIVRRNIVLEYSCGSYEAAKSILTQISEGDYRCLIQDLRLGQTSEGGYRITVDVTYFEHN